jgi:type III secretory pathway component EscR
MEGVNPVLFLIVAAGLAFVPLAAGLVTCYVKINIVLGVLRSALGAQQVPSTLMIMALSLAMTLYIMGPVWRKTEQISQTVNFTAVARNPNARTLRALCPLFEPWREFLERHAGRREKNVLAGLNRSGHTGAEPPPLAGENGDPQTRLSVLVPAFLLTELKQAFAMGFVLLLPFLVIDLIVANILVGMGMYMVSPVMISLPLKLILFVMCDGWLLLSQGLINSYRL